MNRELRLHFSRTDHNQKLERGNLGEHLSKRGEFRCRRNETFHPAIARDVHYLVGVQKHVDGNIDSLCARNAEDGDDLRNGGFQIDALLRVRGLLFPANAQRSYAIDAKSGSP